MSIIQEAKDLDKMLTSREIKLFLFAVFLYVLLVIHLQMKDNFSNESFIITLIFGLPLQFCGILMFITSNRRLSEWQITAAFRRLDQLEKFVSQLTIDPEETELPEAPIEKRWAWGNHTSKALDDLEAAGVRFWGANYDPTDQGTAPTNDIVVLWLVQERGCTTNMAKAIASVLRADGLKPGRR